MNPMTRIGMLFFKIYFALLLHSCSVSAAKVPRWRTPEEFVKSYLIPMIFIGSKFTENEAIAFLVHTESWK